MSRIVACALAQLLISRVAFPQIETSTFQIPACTPNGLIPLLPTLPAEAVQKVDHQLRRLTLREVTGDNEPLSANGMRFGARTLRTLGRSG